MSEARKKLEEEIAKAKQTQEILEETLKKVKEAIGTEKITLEAQAIHDAKRIQDYIDSHAGKGAEIINSNTISDAHLYKIEFREGRAVYNQNYPIKNPIQHSEVLAAATIKSMEGMTLGQKLRHGMRNFITADSNTKAYENRYFVGEIIRDTGFENMSPRVIKKLLAPHMKAIGEYLKSGTPFEDNVPKPIQYIGN